MTTPLAGVRVLELTDESADYCGRLLAGLGADVVKLEPPDGAPARHIGPFLDDEPGPDRSLAFWADNVGKRSVVVGDDTEVVDLCRSADVLVHTLRPAQAEGRGLDAAHLHRLTPGLVVCAVTPFGSDGPWADYLADDLVLMALGGSMAACGYGPGRRWRLRHSPPGQPRRPGVAHGIDLRGHRRAGRAGVALRVGRRPVHRRVGP